MYTHLHQALADADADDKEGMQHGGARHQQVEEGGAGDGSPEHSVNQQSFNSTRRNKNIL